jgi:malto-oligosyltrehalose trehalohydrolase
MSLFGPRLEKGGVRFRLWAPSAENVRLEVDGFGLLPMTVLAEGWKEAFAPCRAGARYRFHIGDTQFPDPASRRQAGGVHGWSIVCAPMVRDGAHDGWRGHPWEEAVLYECHPGLMGGFAGIAEKLPGLRDLGVTAVELMPIAAFPGTRNWGYDGVLPFAPAESYGTPQALRAMLDAAHGLGLMVFLDVVYNHFGPDGNYLPLYAKPFFRADAPTPWGAAIDFRVPQVEAFFAENARHWLLEFGFDGLRFDAVHAMRDEGRLDRLAGALRREAGGRRIHLVLENEDNAASRLRHGFDAQWNDDIHHALHVLLTGETGHYYRDFADAPAARLARALAEGFVYQGEASLCRKGAPRGEPSADLPPSAFVAFLQNHDQIGNRPFGERLTRLADPRALQAAMALLLLSPQIPMLFMGEEIGSRSPFLFFTDHVPALAQAVREGRAREFAAAADAAGGEHPDPNDPRSYAVSDPEADAPTRAQWLALVRALLALRRGRIAPHIKGAASLGAEALGDKAVIARWRLGNGARLTLAANFGAAPVATELPQAAPLWGEAEQADLPAFATLCWIAP